MPSIARVMPNLFITVRKRSRFCSRLFPGRPIGVLLVAVVAVLVTQAVGGDAQHRPGDAEPLHHRAEALQVLLETLPGPSDRSTARSGRCRTRDAGRGR